jgi:hypothetical protein
MKNFPRSKKTDIKKDERDRERGEKRAMRETNHVNRRANSRNSEEKREREREARLCCSQQASKRDRFKYQCSDVRRASTARTICEVNTGRGWARRELVKGRETRSAAIARLVTFISVVDRAAEATNRRIGECKLFSLTINPRRARGSKQRRRRKRRRWRPK